MFALCIKEKNIAFDKYWVCYIIFIACFAISSIFSGYTSEFIHQLFGYYFVAFVGYKSTQVLIQKYNGLTPFIYTLLAIGIIDACATVGQMFNISIINRLVTIIGLNPQEVYDDIISYNGGLAGVAIPGIMGPVANGYYLSAMCILSLYNPKNKLSIFNLTLWAFFAVSLFFVQQRTALAVGLILSLLAMFKIITKGNKGLKVIILLFTSVAILMFANKVYNIVMAGDTRYATLGLDATNRDVLYRSAWQYINNYPFGCYFKFKSEVGYPHNIFLNALIYGGFIGAIAIFIILFSQLKIAIPKLFKKISENNHVLILFSFIFIEYFAVSLTHNLSIVTGDITLWCFWAVIIILENLAQHNQQNSMEE